MVETRGRTGRKPEAGRAQGAPPRKARMDRFSKPPTVAQRACSARRSRPIVFVAVVILIVHQPVGGGDRARRLHAALLRPAGYYTDLFFYRRRQAKELEQGKR